MSLVTRVTRDMIPSAAASKLHLLDGWSLFPLIFWVGREYWRGRIEAIIAVEIAEAPGNVLHELGYLEAASGWLHMLGHDNRAFPWLLKDSLLAFPATNRQKDHA